MFEQIEIGKPADCSATSIALMRDDWLLVPDALRIARRTMAVGVADTGSRLGAAVAIGERSTAVVGAAVAVAATGAAGAGVTLVRAAGSAVAASALGSGGAGLLSDPPAS